MRNLETDRLRHARDAAKILGVSEAWLERKRSEGLGPRWIRVGGPNGRAVRYRESDILAYIEENVVEPTGARAWR